MALWSSLASSHFNGSKLPTNLGPCSPPSRVSLNSPLLVSAACAPTAKRTRSHHHHRHIARPSSLYEVLGIHTGATCQEIKSAYRRLARSLHPDVASNGDDKESTVNEFIKVHEAYATLSDPEKRADYDLSLYRPGRPLSSQFVTPATANTTTASSAASSFSGFGRWRWETDQCW